VRRVSAEVLQNAATASISAACDGDILSPSMANFDSLLRVAQLMVFIIALFAVHS